MLCVWHYMEALNCSSLHVSFLLCPGQVFAQFLQMSSAWHKRFLFGLALIRDLPRGPSAQELGWSWSRWGQGGEGKQETSCKGVSWRGDKIEGEMQNMTSGRREGTWETTVHLGSARLGETLNNLGVPAGCGDKLPAMLVAPCPWAGTCFQVW